MFWSKAVRAFWDECFKVCLSLRKSLKNSLQYSSFTLKITFFIYRSITYIEFMSSFVPQSVQGCTATSPDSYRYQSRFIPPGSPDSYRLAVQTVSVARMTEIEGSRPTLVQTAALLSAINVQVPRRNSWDQSLLNRQCPASYR